MIAACYVLVPSKLGLPFTCSPRVPFRSTRDRCVLRTVSSKLGLGSPRVPFRSARDRCGLRTVTAKPALFLVQCTLFIRLAKG